LETVKRTLNGRAGKVGAAGEEWKVTERTVSTATLGGGCFWCLEAVYLELEGVRAVQSGYAGGHVPDPTYRQVCGGTTGHAEVVQVEFDPTVVTYEDVLRVFFTIHDPTTKDRQGADRGPQYRSIILTHDDAQADTARAVMAEIEEAGVWGAPLVTEVAPLDRFWPAEAVHDDYYRRNPKQPYCRVVIEPKVLKFRQAFADRRKRSD
jgi:peptide-methionine (S)-S-oxide reductase